MAIGYAVKHNRLPLDELLFSRCYSVIAQEGIKVYAVDIDFASYLRKKNLRANTSSCP